MSSSVSPELPTMDPALAAAVTDSLLAALPLPADAGLEQQVDHDTALVAQLDALQPRDLSEMLLAAHARSSRAKGSPALRIWNSGMLHVMAGSVLTLGVVYTLNELFHLGLNLN